LIDNKIAVLPIWGGWLKEYIYRSHGDYDATNTILAVADERARQPMAHYLPKDFYTI
jgi:hypothetical protein